MTPRWRQVNDDVAVLALAPRFGMNIAQVGEVLIDAGTHRAAPRILRSLTNRRVGALALTHVHPDHHGGSHRITAALGIPLWVPDREAHAAESADTRTLAPPSWILNLQQRLWQGPGVPVARRLRQGDHLAAGFTVLDAPGHSPGHIVFWRERDRTLIAGDVLWNLSPITGRPGLREPPKLFTLDPPGNRRTIRGLASLEPATIVFGHGPPLEDAAHQLADFARRLG